MGAADSLKHCSQQSLSTKTPIRLDQMIQIWQICKTCQICQIRQTCQTCYCHREQICDTALCAPPAAQCTHHTRRPQGSPEALFRLLGSRTSRALQPPGAQRLGRILFHTQISKKIVEISGIFKNSGPAIFRIIFLFKYL